LSPYENIDDGTAMVLHYSNVAAAWMAAGRLSLARRLLEVLVDAAPGVPEPLNNLAVVENRLGRHLQALGLLERALGDFPDYPPLYVNAVHAAMAAGRPDVAQSIEERGRAVAEHDPFFLFARGRRLFETQRFKEAAEQFDAAAAAEPTSALLQAWLARACLSAGDYQRGREAWQRARELGPTVALVIDLERQFPELVTAAAEP
jgi:tetratricopeptide (TPR) repeat protein